VTRPAVSIVVPNYNHVRYLPSRLASILDQTWRDFELVLLDDASSDGSRELLERFQAEAAGRGIAARLVANAANGGSPFAQWNRGVELARGRWVWIAESDDEAEPELLAQLVARLERDDGAVLAWCESRLVDEAGGVLAPFVPHPRGVDAELWSRDFVLPGWAFFERHGTDRNPIPNASAVVFDAAAYRAAGGADPALRRLGDWDLWRRLGCRGQVAYCAEPLNRFRTHPASVRSMPASELADFAEFCALARRWLADGASPRLRAALQGAVRRRFRKRVLATGREPRSLGAGLRAARYAGAVLGAPGALALALEATLDALGASRA
jgi:glycosyltransferase involved in cell wall biosynthesis